MRRTRRLPHRSRRLRKRTNRPHHRHHQQSHRLRRHSHRLRSRRGTRRRAGRSARSGSDCSAQQRLVEVRFVRRAQRSRLAEKPASPPPSALTAEQCSAHESTSHRERRERHGGRTERQSGKECLRTRQTGFEKLGVSTSARLGLAQTSRIVRAALKELPTAVARLSWSNPRSSSSEPKLTFKLGIKAKRVVLISTTGTCDMSMVRM